MKPLRELIVLLAAMCMLALASPVAAQRGSPPRPEPAKPAPEPERGPSFVIPMLVGGACVAVMVIVVALPSRRTQDRDGKP
jgi:hypothetical protein